MMQKQNLHTVSSNNDHVYWEDSWNIYNSEASQKWNGEYED